MSKKNMGGLVYSTDPNFCPNSPTNDTIETLPGETTSAPTLRTLRARREGGYTRYRIRRE